MQPTGAESRQLSPTIRTRVDVFVRRRHTGLIGMLFVKAYEEFHLEDIKR